MFTFIIEASFPHWESFDGLEASLTAILISPCIFIMAPRVTPGRCTKCPASCHRCPLSLYLRNLFLLLARSFSLFHTLLLIWVLEETQMPLLPHINVMYCWSQEGAVFFFPPQNLSCSLSVCSYSVSCSLLALRFFLQLLSILVSLFSKHWKRDLNIWRVVRRWTFVW